MRRREQQLAGEELPEPGRFCSTEWADPDDPIHVFCDDAFMRALRRWLDARTTWAFTGGRSIDPTSDIPGTQLWAAANMPELLPRSSLLRK